MGCLGEPANNGYSFIMALPDVHLLLGNEAFVGWDIRAKIDTHVMRSVKEIATLVVHWIVNC